MKKQINYYSILAFNVGFLSIPLYLYLPKYYANNFAIPLSIIGLLIFAIRIFDTFWDLYVGYISNKINNSKKIIIISFLAILLSYPMLFSPPDLIIKANLIYYWLFFTLFFLSLSFSLFYINYYAYGVYLAKNNLDQLNLATTREAITFVGVVFAIIIPQILLYNFSQINAFSIYSIMFVIIGLLALSLFNKLPTLQDENTLSNKTYIQIKNIFINNPLLFSFFLINTLANSISSSLYIFYIEDYLYAKNQELFLMIAFFLSSALSIPLWQSIAKKYSKINILLWISPLAILSFASISLIDNTQINLFYIVSIFSGFLIGADFLYASTLIANMVKNQGFSSTIGFSLYHFLNKLAMSLAIIIALPILDIFNYTNFQGLSGGNIVVKYTYVILPLLFKLISFILIIILKKRGQKYENY
jgi:GPH family glycoside/pentoside/hexuronide:cation symporter